MLYIDIDKEDIPYQFDMDIKDEEFTFHIHYNERFDYFTVDLYKDGEVVAMGDKIVYGRALFAAYPDDAKLPQYPITPIDLGGLEKRVGWDNFMESVFLYIGEPE